MEALVNIEGLPSSIASPFAAVEAGDENSSWQRSDTRVSSLHADHDQARVVRRLTSIRRILETNDGTWQPPSSSSSALVSTRKLQHQTETLDTLDTLDTKP